MLFAAFCWHNEDLRMHSINYNHYGAPKVWYGVPGSHADKFVAAMRELCPELFKVHPDLLFKLITLMPPQALQQMQPGLQICRAVQHKGEFIVTFPRAYHGGFSQGFNCAEAVNFALAEWVPHGRAAVEHYRRFQRNSPFSVDEIVLRSAAAMHRNDLLSGTIVAQSDADGLRSKLRAHVVHDIEFIANRESTLRAALQGVYSALEHRLINVREEPMDDDLRRAEPSECAKCSTFCFLSWLDLRKHPSGRALCLDRRCWADIDPSLLVLRTRCSADEIRQVLKRGASWLTRQRNHKPFHPRSLALHRPQKRICADPGPGAEHSHAPRGWVNWYTNSIQVLPSVEAVSDIPKDTIENTTDEHVSVSHPKALNSNDV